MNVLKSCVSVLAKFSQSNEFFFLKEKLMLISQVKTNAAMAGPRELLGQMVSVIFCCR